jgi:hypothetical protein
VHYKFGRKDIFFIETMVYKAQILGINFPRLFAPIDGFQDINAGFIRTASLNSFRKAHFYINFTENFHYDRPSNC